MVIEYSEAWSRETGQQAWLQKCGHGAKLKVKAFARDEDGTFVVFGLFVFLIMFLVGGVAVDVMNTEHRRVQLQNTLDNAVLASANLQQQQAPEDVITDYFQTSGMIEALDPFEASDFAVKTGERKVFGSAGTEIDTSFLRLLGLNSLPALASAAAEEAQTTSAPENREISVVIDISGSMRNNGRIDELRSATKDLVTILLTGDAADTTSVNVVPYAGHVNPGPEMFELLGGIEYGTTGGHTHTDLDRYPESRQDISNMAFYFGPQNSGEGTYTHVAKLQGYPNSDVSLFNKDDPDEYIYHAEAYLKRVVPGISASDRIVGVSYKAGGTIYGPYTISGTMAGYENRNKGKVDWEGDFNSFYGQVIAQFSSCVDYGPDDFAHTALPDNTYYDQVPHFMNWPIHAASMDWGWCPEDDSAVQYAQNDEAALHAFIDSLRLHDGSGAHHGLKYGLALLDPSSNDEFQELSWHGLVPTYFADRPAAWDDTKTKKYIVLMSEGVVATEWRPENPLDPDNDSVALTDQPDNPSMLHTGAATNVESFYSLCDAAKAEGVEIFAVAFEASDTGKEQLADCASSAAHFFDVDGADLSSVFGNVGAQLTQLRLTQ